MSMNGGIVWYLILGVFCTVKCVERDIACSYVNVIDKPICYDNTVCNGAGICYVSLDQEGGCDKVCKVCDLEYNSLSECISMRHFVCTLYSYVKAKLSCQISQENKHMLYSRFEEIYTHFSAKRASVDEAVLFLTNSFFGTGFLKIFLFESLLNHEVARCSGYDKSRGLLQITGQENYAIANMYDGNTNFVAYPYKMAYLSADAVRATLYYWDRLIENVEKQGMAINYENVLSALMPEEAVSREGKNKERLKNRSMIYKELLLIFQC